MNNILQNLNNIKDPKQFVLNYLSQTSNPMIGNLAKMAEGGNQQQIEQFATNLLKQQGVDLNFFKQFFK